MQEGRAQPFPAHDHDHGACLAHAVWRAKETCVAAGIKWTELREQIFRQLASHHKPISAYDLIDGLAKEGRRLAPVSVYRILEVLQGAGLVHRLESRNAFYACMTEHADAPQTITFVCDDCERVSEVIAPEAYRAVYAAAEASNFYRRRAAIEVTGQCSACHGAAISNTSC